MQFILSLSRIWQLYSVMFRICGIMGYFDKTKILIKSKYRLKKIYYCELYSIVYCEIMFFNDNQYFYVYLYWEKAKWDI